MFFGNWAGVAVRRRMTIDFMSIHIRHRFAVDYVTYLPLLVKKDNGHGEARAASTCIFTALSTDALLFSFPFLFSSLLFHS
jgi:hypothetical protein